MGITLRISSAFLSFASLFIASVAPGAAPPKGTTTPAAAVQSASAPDTSLAPASAPENPTTEASGLVVALPPPPPPPPLAALPPPPPPPPLSAYGEAPSWTSARPAPESPNTERSSLDFRVKSIGGFGGIAAQYTRFAGADKAQLCAEGGVLLEHALSLGAGVCGIANNVNAEQYGPAPHTPKDRMGFVYGGGVLRYHFFSRRWINLGVGALVGGGSLTIGTWDGQGDNWERDYTNRKSDGVFVFEPQIGAYANLTRWLRMGATASYRAVSRVNTLGLASSDLSGPTLGGGLYGGWF